jgi:hypothetical protein
LKLYSLSPTASLRTQPLPVQPTVSILLPQEPSGRRCAARAAVLLAVTACCAALLSAVTTGSAAASPITTPAYTTTADVSDGMARTVSSGFGTANQGGSYATVPATGFSVSGGAGRIASVSSGTHAQATLSAATPADQRLLSMFVLPTLPASGIGVSYQLELRRNAYKDAYRIMLQVAPGGRLTLAFALYRGGVQTAIGLPVTLSQYAKAGQTVILEGMVAGSTAVLMRARAWLAGTAAPGWQLGASHTAANRLTAGGQVGIYLYVSSNTASTAVRVVNMTGWRLTSTATVVPAGGKPGSANTGVPAGTVLTQHTGTITVTVAGTHLDAMDIHGFLVIKAANVLVTRSIIRGGVATVGTNPGLVSDTSTAGTNFVLQDSTIVPEHPSVALDGVRGANYTLTRVNVHGTVDGAKVIGNNVTIQNSWLHDTVYYASDPFQGGQHTHNDGVQVLSGTKIRLVNNTITTNYNSALQVTQGNGVVSDIWFNGNWADGGGCSVNINNGPLGTMTGVVVNSNRFGHATRVANCPIVATRAAGMASSYNVYDDTNAAVVVKYG